MNRRYFIAASSVGAVTGVTGCLGNGNSEPDTDAPPSIDGEGLELVPGESSVLTVHAENVGSINFTVIPDLDAVEFAFDDASFSERPDGQDDSYPPYWNWSPPASAVDIDVPVRVGDTVTGGEYPYEVAAWHVDVESGENRGDADAVTEENVLSIVTD